MKKIVAAGLALFALTRVVAAGDGAVQKPADRLDALNVVWDSPSANSRGSMPLGNGDISANTWVEPSGDLVMIVGKTDSFCETGRLLKIGRVRVKFSPALPVRPFTQTLLLRSGQMVVTAGEGPDTVTVRVWVDACNPVIRVECDSRAPRSCQANVELWRTAEKPHVVAPGEHSENGLEVMDKTVVDLADTLVPAGAGSGQVTWYHRNTRSIYATVLKTQHLEALTNKCPDPLIGSTFGAVLAGSGMTAAAAGELRSSAAAPRRVISVSVLTAVTPTAEAWLDQAGKLAARMNALDVGRSRAAHENWWKSFWDRSWITVLGKGAGQADNGASVVTRGYTLQRYMLACCSRGPLPPKFNGATLTVDPEGNDPDYRRWGSNYWFQNNRWLDWPLLATGDYEMMQPFFAMYLQALPLAKERTRLYYGHEGAYFPETMYFWGTYNCCDFGINNTGNDAGSGYIRWYWQGGIELAAMMLDYYDHTQDKAFARETLVPVADAVVAFFDRHWKRGPDGKIRFDPAQSLETWHVAVNPQPEVAGLRYVLPRLLALPQSLTTAAQRAAWTKTLADLPPVPTLTADGKTRLAPAESFSNRANTENAELYAVFPYRLYGVGKPQLQLARAAFDARAFREYGCWKQNGVHAALVGDVDEAFRSVVAHFSKGHAPQRFPSFWDAGFDWTPDMDNGGTAMTALQYMLMQTDGKTIRLLPAWPAQWDADFKLHAPYETVVEGSVRAGKLLSLKVTPKSRASDVVNMLEKQGK